MKRVFQFQIPLIIILFLVNLLMGEVLYLFGHDTPVCFVRNWLMTGMPAFLLGNHIHQSNKNHSKYFVIILCTLGIAESWMAFRIIGKGDTYLGSILLAYGLVYGVRLFSKIRCVVLSYIGSACSLFIYLYHILIGEILTDVRYRVIIVYLSCILLSLIYNRIIKIIKSSKKILES